MLSKKIVSHVLWKYRPRWQTPIKVALSGDQTAYTLPAPSSGPLVAFMLNVLDGFIPASNDVTTHQRVIETMKYAYGMRTRLGDPLFVDIEEVFHPLLKCSR
jgi:gamma-glutamyltranspeptidase / glutathione hydrolase / leukotriene-C4 hydrolase